MDASPSTSAPVPPRFTSPTSGLQHQLSTFHESGRSSPGTGAGAPPTGTTTNQQPANVTASTSAAVDQPSYLGYLSGVVSYFWPAASSGAAAVDHQHALPAPPVTATPQQVVIPVVVVKKPLPSVKPPSRSELESRAVGLVKKVILAESGSSKLLRTDELCAHLLQHPASKSAALSDRRLLPSLLKRLRGTTDDELRARTKECLVLLGHVDPPKGHGVRILTIDGGGTRGMMGLEILEALEEECGGTKICQLFDHIVGVSTGAVLAALLGGYNMDVQRCKEIYRALSRDLFSQGKFSGVSGLLLSHSYYNTKKWIELLKKTVGPETTVLETARDPNTPKLAFVSCIVNMPQMHPFIFRNYELPAGRESHFRGGTHFKVWQALQASAAAPGYFEEVLLGQILHQDGGVLVNNPSAIALHETKLLWPNERIQCMVSVGNGRSSTVPDHLHTARDGNVSLYTGWQEKIAKIVDSATDTELVHMTLRDLLPTYDYYRLNPYMSHPYTLDEIDPAKLEQMIKDAKMYVRKNRLKIRKAAGRLQKRRNPYQRAVDGVTYECASRFGWQL